MQTPEINKDAALVVEAASYNVQRTKTKTTNVNASLACAVPKSPENSTLPKIVGKSFRPEWIRNLSNESYHSDLSTQSSTGLKPILKSQKAYIKARLKPQIETAGIRIGTALHMAILEPERFAKTYVVSPEFKGTGSRSAKVEWLATLPKGTMVLTQDERNSIEEMSDSVLSHTEASRMLKLCEPEISGFYSDEETGIACRIRPDLYSQEHGILIDVKTTRDSCDIETFSKTIWKYRYDFSLSFYREGIRRITEKVPDYALFLAVESTHPYECALYLADDQMLEKGMQDYRLAMSRLKDCILNNEFTPIQTSLQTISLPKWAVA